MRSTGARIAIAAAAVALAVVLFIVLQSDDGDNGGETSTRTTVQGPQVITVRDGDPVGGVKSLSYDKGEQVNLEVRLDRPAEEIHVHGYEIEKPAETSPVRLSFPARLDGVFEIELHTPDGGEAEIAELTVNP